MIWWDIPTYRFVIPWKSKRYKVTPMLPQFKIIIQEGCCIMGTFNFHFLPSQRIMRFPCVDLTTLFLNRFVGEKFSKYAPWSCSLKYLFSEMKPSHYSKCYKWCSWTLSWCQHKTLSIMMDALACYEGHIEGLGLDKTSKSGRIKQS